MAEESNSKNTDTAKEKELAPWKAHAKRFQKSKSDSMDPSAKKKARGEAAPAEPGTAGEGTAAEGGEGTAWTYRVDHGAMRAVNNPRFLRYYRELHPIAGTSDAEWDAFITMMRTPLPTTIWINDIDPMAKLVSEYFQSKGSEVASPIPWYPIPGMGWRINVDKVRFRRDPAFQPLRRFLVTQTASGIVSRQEEVSMIPVFLLDIKSTDCCLDMCASPGSKTAQMLVALGRGKVIHTGLESSLTNPPFDYNSKGCVVANELDAKRANMLVYQVKRLRPLFPFALFTNHDARFLPQPKMADGSELEYDKILCDVVCSGDGTLRKAPHLVGQWKPSMGLNLQPLQVQIALRGCHALKVGGRMVYSTCSLNPIENEAVVSQLVKRTNGAMKLVSVAPELLPNLQYDKGLTSWHVVDAKGNVVTDPVAAGLHPGLFPVNPPMPGLDLSLCLRLMPQHCNGGGFFVAVLEKVSPWKLSSKEIQQQEEEHEAKEKEKRRQARLRAAGEKATRDEAALRAAEIADETNRVSRAPKYFPAPPSAKTCFEEFYRCPNVPCSQLVVRCDTEAEMIKTRESVTNTVLYFTSASVNEILMQRDPRCTIVSAGVRAFKFERMAPQWRIAAEAASIFAPYLSLAASPRLLTLDLEIVDQMLKSGPLKDILFNDIQNAQLQTKIRELKVGPLVFIIEGKHGLISCPGFRARSRIQLFVDKEDVVGLKNRLGIQISEDELKSAEQEEAVPDKSEDSEVSATEDTA